MGGFVSVQGCQATLASGRAFMPISIICSNCKANFRVPAELAGRVVACPTCQAHLQIPASAAPLPVALQPHLERVLGHQSHIFMDVLGLHTNWSEEFSPRDLLLFVLSLRHIFFLAMAFVLFFSYSADAESARTAAPFYFWIGWIVFIAGWIQMDRIARSQSRNIAVGSSGFGPRIVAAALLPTTDFRAAIPGVRTLVLGMFMLFAGLRLVDDSGTWRSIMPIPSFSSTDSRGYHPHVEPVAPTATAPAAAPAAPTPEDMPLPPPEE
jgi:hypothetical protein